MARRDEQRDSFWDNHFQNPGSEWVSYTRAVALHRNVLVVATSRIEGAWCAYIGPVRGYDHTQEWQEVLDNGDKIGEDLAKILFPGFTGVPYAR